MKYNLSKRCPSGQILGRIWSLFEKNSCLMWPKHSKISLLGAFWMKLIFSSWHFTSLVILVPEIAQNSSCWNKKLRTYWTQNPEKLRVWGPSFHSTEKFPEQSKRNKIVENRNFDKKIDCEAEEQLMTSEERKIVFLLCLKYFFSSFSLFTVL